MSHCQNGRKVCFIQSCFLLFAPDSALKKLLFFQLVQRNMPDPSEVFGSLIAMDFASNFAPCYVQGPAELILNIPMLPSHHGKLFRTKFG